MRVKSAFRKCSDEPPWLIAYMFLRGLYVAAPEPAGKEGPASEEGPAGPEAAESAGEEAAE